MTALVIVMGWVAAAIPTGLLLGAVVRRRDAEP